jgi:hypothetical protein
VHSIFLKSGRQGRRAREKTPKLVNLEGTLIGNVKASIRLIAGRNVRLWEVYQRMRGRHLPSSKHADLVLEGYPRSGNTYAEHMLRIMCPGLHWISHTHSPGTLHWARKHHIPTLILIREPLDAAISLFIYRMQQVSLSLCLHEWEAFHNAARGLKNVAFIPFQTLVSDTEASVVKSLHSLGLQDAIKAALPENPRRSFEASHDHDKWHLREVRGIAFGEEQGNRPSDNRKQMAETINTAIKVCETNTLQEQLRICNLLYINMTVEPLNRLII